MSKFDDAMAEYRQELEKIGVKDVDDELLRKVTKGLGPLIYNNDAAKVSASDPEELMRVKNNFLIKKLGMEDSPALDQAIQQVITTLGSANRNKYRAVFYYLLVKNLSKEANYG